MALALAIVGGVFGLHRFYTGHTKSGIWMAATLGGLGIWYLYDVIVVAAGEFVDAEGRRVVRWAGAGAALHDEVAPGRVAELEDRVRGLAAQVNELAERVDFAERMLARPREPEQLPRGS